MHRLMAESRLGKGTWHVWERRSVPALTPWSLSVTQAGVPPGKKSLVHVLLQRASSELGKFLLGTPEKGFSCMPEERGENQRP